RQTASGEAIEKHADVFAVADAGECLVLPSQAVAAVQHDAHEELCLALGKAQRSNGVHPLDLGHPSHSNRWGSSGVPPVRVEPPCSRAPAARYIEKPERAFPDSCARE